MVDLPYKTRCSSPKIVFVSELLIFWITDTMFENLEVSFLTSSFKFKISFIVILKSSRFISPINISSHSYLIPPY